MKIKHLTILILVAALLGSCGAFKKDMAQTGGKKEAIQNAILDFSNSSVLYKKDSVFSISILDPLLQMVLEDTDDGNGKWVEGKPYHGMVAVNVGADYNKILLTDSIVVNKKNASLPSRFIEKEGKLFYWWDDDYPLTHEALNVFRKYNLLVKENLDGVLEYYEFKINDAQKGVDYYFCKNDLTKYKKITTNKAIGFYDPPSLDCILE